MHIVSGILRDKTIADKLMYIPNDDIQNYPFFRILLVAQLNIPTNQNSNSQIVFKQRIKQRYYKTLGTSAINSPISPPGLHDTF